MFWTPRKPRERNNSRWLIALCSVVFSVFAAFAAPVQITEKTNPKIVELYQKLQDKRAEVSGIESKRVDALNENLNAMRENEQRIENRILGATTTLATGMGAMQAATGLAETAADERALADMRAYLSTFVCEFGNGQNVEYGPGDVTLPGGNELMEYYNEYKTLAEDLRKTKVALGLAPGIESEEILERADTGLYDNVAIGKTSGMYASLARGILNPDGDDAAQIAADTQKSAEKLKAGAIATGAGVVGGIIGNYKINKDAPKESSKQINQEYDAQVSKINQEATQIETELDAAIAENAAAVREYNAAVESARKNVDEIQRAPTDCQELFSQYITDVSKLELVENETDSVPDITLPEMDSDLLTKCVQCKNKDAIFDAAQKTCECPAERPLEQDGKCIAKPAEPKPVVVVPGVGDDGTDDIKTKTEEETKTGADDPNICAIGLKHTAGFGIVAGETRVGDRCTSAQVLDGKVFKRQKDGTCGCTAIVCETRAGRAAMAVGGRCVCDADRGYKDDKGKCVCDTDKGYKLVNGQCVNQNAGGTDGKGAEQPATPAPQKKYKYYNCGNANKGTDNWDAQTKAAKPNATCEWVGGAFNRRNVTPMQADGLMKEWALEKYNDTIVCDDKSHRTSAEIKSFGDKWRNCVSTGPKEKYYEFAFNSLSNGNGGFYDALCSMYGLKQSGSKPACKKATKETCDKISVAVARTFYPPDGNATLNGSECRINEHPNASSAVAGGFQTQITTSDQLRTLSGVNPLYFYDKSIQVSANADIYRIIRDYLFKNLRLPVKEFSCGAAFSDNIKYFDGTKQELTAIQKARADCVKNIDIVDADSEISMCYATHEINTITGDLLKCTYDGQPVDFLFKKLDAWWNKKSTGGYQNLWCLNEGGTFSGKSCALADKQKCDDFQKRFLEKYPDSKGMKWDDELGCILKDAKEVHTIQKVAEVTGMGALTLVTAVSGGPIVWVLSAVEATALVTEAVTADKLSDWAEGFIVDAARCNDSNCADRVLKNHIARVIKGSKYFTDTQGQAIARQIERLTGMLSEETLNGIDDQGYKDLQNGKDRDTVLENAILDYYGTKLTGAEKTLLRTNKVSTIMTFATLAGAGVMAGLRQAVKRNWIKLSPDRQLRWVEKWKILRPDDVAGLGGTGARGAGGATDANDAARAGSNPKKPKDGGPSGAGEGGNKSGGSSTDGAGEAKGHSTEEPGSNRTTNDSGTENAATGATPNGAPGKQQMHSDLSGYQAATDKKSAKRKLLIKYHPDKVAGYNDAKLSQLAEDITQRVNNIDNLSESELRKLSQMMDEFDNSVDAAESAKRAADAAKNTGNKSTGAETSDDASQGAKKASNADDAARGAENASKLSVQKLKELGFTEYKNGIYIGQAKPSNITGIKYTKIQIDDHTFYYVAISDADAAKQGLKWANNVIGDKGDFVRAFNSQSSYRISKLNGAISGRKPITEINGVPVYITDFGVRGGRPIAMVEVNGRKLPFYISTGDGGKMRITTGKWEFFSGIRKEDGWFRKGPEDGILKHYNVPELRTIAEALDASIGDIRDTELVLSNAFRASKNGPGTVAILRSGPGISDDLINSGLKHDNLFDNVTELRNWFSDLKPKPKATSGTGTTAGRGAASGASNAGARAAGSTTNINTLRNRASSSFDKYLDQVKTNATGKGAKLPKGRLTDAEWEAVNKSLAHENVQLVEVVQDGEHYMQFRRADAVDDAASAARGAASGTTNRAGTGAGTGSTTAKTGAKATNATGNTPQTLNQIKRKVAGNNFDDFVKSAKQGGFSPVLNVSDATDEEWKLLNKSLENDGLQLVDDGAGHMQFRRADAVDDAASATRGAASGTTNRPGTGAGTGSTTAKTGAKATNATVNTPQTLNQIKRKVAGNNFDDFVKSAKQGGFAPVLNVSDATDEEWKLLNKSLENDGLKLVDDGAGHMQFRRADAVDDVTDATRARASTTTKANDVDEVIELQLDDMFDAHNLRVSDGSGRLYVRNSAQEMLGFPVSADDAVSEVDQLYGIIRRGIEYPVNDTKVSRAINAMQNPTSTGVVYRAPTDRYPWHVHSYNGARSSAQYHVSLNVKVDDTLIKKLDEIIAKDRGQHIIDFKIPPKGSRWKTMADPISIYMRETSPEIERAIAEAARPYVRTSSEIGLLGRKIDDGVAIAFETSDARMDIVENIINQVARKDINVANALRREGRYSVGETEALRVWASDFLGYEVKPVIP